MLPKLENKDIFFEVLKEVSYPNRRGYKNSVVRLNAGGPARRITPGDYDLYGRVVNWVIDGRARFVEAPNRPKISGQAKLGD